MSDRPKRRWFRFAFSLRTLFLVMTAVALGIFAKQMIDRRSEFLGRAQVHSHAAGVPHFADHPSPEGRAIMDRQLEAYRSYHHQLRDKYQRAANLPWLSVEPDSPAPALFENLPPAEMPIEERPSHRMCE